MRVRLLYFASLRDASGCEAEDLDIGSATLARLYDDARTRYGFAMSREHVRVAVDGSFADWTMEPHEGAEIAFLPPVSGG